MGVNGVALDVADGHLVVDVADLLDQCLAGGFRLVEDVGGNLAAVGFFALLAAESPTDHLGQVDDAAEVLLGADRHLDGHGVGLETVDHHLLRTGEVGADAVHLVHEADAGDGIAVGLAPDGFGLGLDTGDGIEDDNAAIKHAQPALDFSGEVDVAGRIDDVDEMVVPLGAGGGGGDGDAALALLLHPVHRGGAFVDLADLVGDARVVEDALGHGGLAGIDVSDDADVAHAFDLVRPGHDERSPVPDRAAYQR